MIMNKKYTVIDDLRLSPCAKCRLWIFVLEKINHYFFFRENQLSKINQLKCIVLDIMVAQNQPDERKRFKTLFKMSEETACKMVDQQSTTLIKIDEQTTSLLGNLQ